jgi:hypothetical protein
MAEYFFSLMISKLQMISLEQQARLALFEWELATVKVLINWFRINILAIEAALNHDQQRKSSSDMIDKLRILLLAIYRLSGNFIWEGHFQRLALREDFELRGFLPLDAFFQSLQFNPLTLISDEWEERIRFIISSGSDLLRSLKVSLPWIRTSSPNPYLCSSVSDTSHTFLNQFPRESPDHLNLNLSTSTAATATMTTFKDRPRNLSALDPQADEVIVYSGKQPISSKKNDELMTTSHGGNIWLHSSKQDVVEPMASLPMFSNHKLSSTSLPQLSSTLLSSPTASHDGNDLPAWTTTTTTTTTGPLTDDTQTIRHPFGKNIFETHLTQFPSSERYSPFQPALVSTHELLPPPLSVPKIVQHASLKARSSSQHRTQE